MDRGAVHRDGANQPRSVAQSGIVAPGSGVAF
jgi:hypothetical protein